MTYRLLLFAALLGTGFTLGFVRGGGANLPVLSAAVEEKADAITAFRTEREQLRAMERAQLNDIIHNDDTEEGVLALAQRRLVEISGAEEAETNLEGILALRGWEDCIVTLHNDGVNVLVPTDMLTRQQSSLILDLACRETGAQAGNVKIIPINSAK